MAKLEEILEETAVSFEVDKEEIKSRKRTQKLCIPRNIYMLLGVESGYDRRDVAGLVSRNRTSTYKQSRSAQDDVYCKPFVRQIYNSLKQKYCPELFLTLGGGIN